jgi:hypothetical protein
VLLARYVCVHRAKERLGKLQQTKEKRKQKLTIAALPYGYSETLLLLVQIWNDPTHGLILREEKLLKGNGVYQ